MSEIDFATLIPKLDQVLARGLSNGLGVPGEQVCVEAAICEVLGLPHGDDPKCVSNAVRRYKIRLNDSTWSSPEARAKGLRSLAIAQLGSLGVVDDREFSKRLAEKTIRVLIPTLFREVLAGNKQCIATADKCEQEGTYESAVIARKSADAAAAYAAYAAADAANAAAYAADVAAVYAAYAADAAADTAAAAARHANQTSDPDKYLLLSAKLALEVLTELGAPGVKWIE